MEDQAIELPENFDQLARAAGFAVEQGKIFAEHREGMCTEEVHALARALIATERERCAKVCDAQVGGRSKDDVDTDHPSDSVTWGEIFGAEQCAKAIREG